MTKDEILEMPAGREMDALVAVLVGWIVEDFTAISPKGGRWARNVHGDDDWLPYYSTDISDSWKVVEFMKSTGAKSDVFISHEFNGKWCVTIENEINRHDVVSQTAELAICRAALLTVAE